MFDTEKNQHSSLTFLKSFIVLTHTLSVNRFLCLTPFISHEPRMQTQKYNRLKERKRISSRNEVMIRTQVFFPPFSLCLQRPSNPPSTSKPWSSDSSNHILLKMSLSSENGSMQKSIKGFNVMGLPWLHGLLSVIHQVALSHSLLLVCNAKDRERALCVMAAPLLQVDNLINTNCICLTKIVFSCLIIWVSEETTEKETTWLDVCDNMWISYVWIIEACL